MGLGSFLNDWLYDITGLQIVRRQQKVQAEYAPAIKQAIREDRKIWLDIGCGINKQKGAIGMDVRNHPDVDINHNICDLPLPIPDNFCYRVLMSHLVEHLPPEKILDIMDEIWRITIPNGQLLIATPYAGTPRFWQDPSHIHGWTEVTPQYFDPQFPLWHVYRIKPWKIENNAWESYGDLTVIMAKRESADIPELAPLPYGGQEHEEAESVAS